MQASKRHLDANVVGDDEHDLPPPKYGEDLADQLAVRASLLGLCLALLLAVIWVVNRPSFEKCSTLETVTERYACYDQLRSELLKAPAKGADFRL